MRRVARRLSQRRPPSRGRLALFLAGGIVTAILLVVVLVSLDQHSPVQSALPEPPVGPSPETSTPSPRLPVQTTDEPSSTAPETFTFYDTLEQRNAPSPGWMVPSGPPSRRVSPAAPPGETGAARKNRPAGYTIQIAALKDRPTAEVLADRLKSKGYPVFILPHVVPGQGTWYRVRVGHFTKREAAQEMAQQLSRQERLTTYIAKE